MDQKKTGARIGALRREKGLTQEQLAERLGVSRRTVSRWETGSNLPDLDLLLELTDLFGVGLRELLIYLKEHGCKTGVATASSQSWTQRNVREAGIDHLFDTYTYGEMVSHAKPDPEIFLLAAKMLGEKPEKCLVLEDSFNGVEAGLSGGFLTVMVPDLSFPGPELKRRLTAECESLLGVIELFEQGFFYH